MRLFKDKRGDAWFLLIWFFYLIAFIALGLEAFIVWLFLHIFKVEKDKRFKITISFILIYLIANGIIWKLITPSVGSINSFFGFLPIHFLLGMSSSVLYYVDKLAYFTGLIFVEIIIPIISLSLLNKLSGKLDLKKSILISILSTIVIVLIKFILSYKYFKCLIDGTIGSCGVV